MMYHDESGVSVIIGTLLLILITITAASGLALMVSGMQKEAMDRESHLAAVESENLRIIAIDPVGNDTHWHSVNVTLMNLNTEDSRITTISLNGDHARNYLAKDASGDLDYYKGSPAVYNFKKRVVVPATRSKEICLNFTEIVINTSEDGNITFWNTSPGWTNNSENYTYPLPNHPYIAYPYVLYPDMEYDETVYNVTNTSNITVIPRDGKNYTMDDTTGNITLFGSAYGNMTNTSIYNITYTTRFVTFPPPSPMRKNEPLTIEVITSLINIFKRTFMPPVPLAEVQVRSEWISSNKTRDYLVLDASESFDTDGYIVGFNWSLSYDCDQLWQACVNNETFNCTNCGDTWTLSCKNNNSNFNTIVNTADLRVSNETMVFGTDLDNANYTIDAPNGTITCNCSGNMSNHTEYNITYCYICNGTEGRVHHLTGMKVRVNIANLHHEHCDECGPFDIDLDVIDDTGMIANLAQQSGKIYIPENQNFNNS